MGDLCSSELGTDRKSFGAGLKRKRIEFVPADASSPAAIPKPAPHRSLGDRYLSITLSNGGSLTSSSQIPGTSDAEDNDEVETANEPKDSIICKMCKLPIHTNEYEAAAAPLLHEVSLAHQICVEHSYPPSHLDRNRHGLKYLSSYGWDPDSRLGLGVLGAGIKVPVKTTVKHDTVGLGVKLPEGKQKMEEAVEKLNPKEMKILEAKDRKTRDKLHQMFYGNDDVERYLGA